MRACSVQRKIKYLRACSGWVAGRRGGLGEGGIHCCGGSKGKRDNAIFKLLNVRMQGYVGDSRDYINIVTSFSSRYGVHSSLITPAQGLKPKFSQPAAAQVIDSSPCAPFIPVYSSFPSIFLDSFYPPQGNIAVQGTASFLRVKLPRLLDCCSITVHFVPNRH